MRSQSFIRHKCYWHVGSSPLGWVPLAPVAATRLEPSDVSSVTSRFATSEVRSVCVEADRGLQPRASPRARCPEIPRDEPRPVRVLSGNGAPLLGGLGVHGR